jgi:uncharacterized protein involved in type VI secretion and phage assembly
MKSMPGVVTGIVKSLNDPSGQGRIQLQFPWLSDATRSSWAPVAAPLAGKGRGAFFMPEVDDEVLVAFEHGNFDHPYIVGFLWNGVDMPPESTNQNRVLVTPGGHTLRFEDKSGQRRIKLKSAGGHQIAIDDVSNTVVISTNSGATKITLDDNANSIELLGGGRTLKMAGGQFLIS